MFWTELKAIQKFVYNVLLFLILINILEFKILNKTKPKKWRFLRKILVSWTTVRIFTLSHINEIKYIKSCRVVLLILISNWSLSIWIQLYPELTHQRDADLLNTERGFLWSKKSNEFKLTSWFLHILLTEVYLCEFYVRCIPFSQSHLC